VSDYLIISSIQSHSTARAADVNSRFQQVESAFDMLPAPDVLELAVKPTVVAGGTLNALTVTNTQPVTSYVLGQEINFKAAFTNSGAATVNVDGLGNKEIRRHDGTALAAGDLIAGRIFEAKYDGSYFQLMNVTAADLAAYTTSASTSAATATTKAAEALASAVAAAASAAAAAASALSIDASNLMHLSGVETVTGAKTFSGLITASAGIKINSQTLDTLSANGCSLIEAADYAAMRTLLTLVPGTNVLPMSGGTLTGALTLNADPSAALDAATKQYVDALAAGMDPKGSVVCATTANITLSGAQTIDGVSAVAGNRVLVKDQSSASGNGIYVVAAGAWTRATDMDSWLEVPGAFCFVEQGTVNADRGFVCTSNAGGTLGSTSITFSQFFGLGSYAATGLATASGLTQSTSKLLGRTTASTGAIEEISVGSGLTFASGSLSVTNPVISAAMGSTVGYTSATPAVAASITLPTAGTYRLRACGFYSSSSTSTGLLAGFTQSVSNPVFGSIAISAAGTGTPTFGAFGSTFASGSTWSVSGANAALPATGYSFQFDLITIISSSTTIDLKLANTAATGTVTVGLGTTIWAEKIA
jgi:hypothetical protein